jgi:non-specific serine/threonine protein kinase
MTKKNGLQFIFTADFFYLDDENQIFDDKSSQWQDLFRQDAVRAMYQLGFAEACEDASPSFVFLHHLATVFLEQLTRLPELELVRGRAVVSLSDDQCRALLQTVPYALGAEYIDAAWLRHIFLCLQQEFSRDIADYQGTVSLYLAERSQNLRVPERIFFHLVENRHDDAFPFAFLATYATRDASDRVRHMPLQFALTEFKDQRQTLLTLLACLDKAAEVSSLIAGFVKSGEMFHPLRLRTHEAYDFLKHVEDIEKAGILCRIPNWWKQRDTAVSLTVQLGEKKTPILGFDTLLSMQPGLMVNGEMLTQQEIKKLLAQTEGLALLKGKWVEVDHQKLRDLLTKMDQYQGELSLREALRLQSGVEKNAADPDNGPLITNGSWLQRFMRQLHHPETIRMMKVPATVHAVLRPYQETGFTWLQTMGKLGFGMCLADDMGLGKTLQILAYLETMRRKDKQAAVLLIVPASLLGNWEKEIERFTPRLSFTILHGHTAATLTDMLAKKREFLTITTYGMAARLPVLQQMTWTCLILDEAQAIKNPAARQTKTIKKIQAAQRIAMTGTPIENDLTNLWSLFDFLNQGLLGTAAEFKRFAGKLSNHPEGYGRLKHMVSPFILRRLKTDKTVIRDLPEKLEQIDYIQLTKKQVILYRKQVAELEEKLSCTDGMERRGLVLATITKLKQICNHPDQFLGQSDFAPADSGKFEMLRELCQTISEKRERVLVFTQYREITEYLADYLENVFGRKGFVIHGGTRVKKRTEMVDAFNGNAYVPFMVLSVKAAGTGLNLAAANHVIHFDRWWNPAVENQATDRAYRIGQKKDVMVHKLVSAGTIEEKIDTVLSGKNELAEQVLGKGTGKWITELDDTELLNMMRLTF